MALRRIVTYGTPVLRQRAREVTELDGELQQLIDDMVETMYRAPGVGLAAPQVGVLQRMFVVGIPAEYDEDGVLVSSKPLC